VKVPGRVTSPGRTQGKDARESQKIRPILIVLVLFVIVFGIIFGLLFFASSQTKNDVRRLVQTQCRLASTSFAGDVTIEGGTARIPYVDSTGSHTAIVRLGADRAYSLDTCGR
jgi:hypothetical protein